MSSQDEESAEKDVGTRSQIPVLKKKVESPCGQGFAKLAQSFTSSSGGDEENEDGGEKDPELIAFQKEGQEICNTMGRMARKMDEIEKNADPRKRVEVS